MTEAEWLAATDPTPMLEFLHDGKASDRKLLLFCLVWCPTYYREGAECERYSTAFRFAEGDCGLDELRMAWIRDDDPAYPSNASLPEKPFLWARALTRSKYQLAGVPPGDQAPPLIREIFGNPFRPITVNPSWLTSDVVVLATGIYQDLAFDRMPILADALQDAGCDNGDILNHCRQPGEHVRGCWVVDLLTGRK
jgi:hypothetical protein